MQILLGILDSIRRGISFVAGTITNLTYFSAVYAPLTNGSFFAFGEASGGTTTNSYSYSTDGLTWSTGTLPSTTSWYASVSNGSRIIAFRANNQTSFYSDNGTTWTQTSALAAGSISPRNAIWDGTRFIITEGASGTGTVRYSTDGITWSGTSINQGSQSSRFIGFDGTSRYIAINTATNDSAYSTTSTFPTTWTALNFPSTAATWGQPIYGNGLWLVAKAGTTGYVTSATGTGSWTSRTLPSQISDSTSERDAKFLFNSGKFYYYYADNVYSSTNGIDWVTETTITGDTLDQVTGWAVGPNKVIGVGQASASSGSGIYLNGSK